MFGPGIRLTLIGVDEQAIPLWRPGEHRDGVKLTAVPQMDSIMHETVWQQAVGQVGSTWTGQTIPPGQGTLKCKVVGPNVRRTVGDFLDALGDGTRECTLIMATTDKGWRWVKCRFASLSEIEWWGDPANPVGAGFSVMLDYPRPVWRRFEAAQVFTAADLGSGQIQVTVDGGRPVWPVIEISGQFTTVSFGFGGALQTLPYRADGYRIITDPEHRSITPHTGGEQIKFTGHQPYWPTAPRPSGTPPTITINTDITGAGADFKFNVTLTPEVGRPW